jgi:predicted TIM-barrel fold metal-dependent hydrolase
MEEAMSERLGYPVFDADNHMYEQKDAFTRYLPDEYKNVLQYVQVNGRDKLAIKGRITEYIPNPTFVKVAAPGAQEDFFKNGNPEGKSRREILGKAITAPEAFFRPEPRLALMDEQGVDRAIMWPTLASVLEERLSDDPEATHAIVHSLNQWMYEEWSFNYEDRIYAAPVITLPIVDEAIKELDWLVERGAKLILIRPAPVPSLRGYRSFALPEFDPFWSKVEEYNITVGMHSSDDGMTRYFNQWEGHYDEHLPFANVSAFQDIQHYLSRGIFDAMASAIGHGMLSRHPKLRILPVENGSSWVLPLIEAMGHSYAKQPKLYDEDPVEVLRRNVWIHPFFEENPIDLIKAIGTERVVFGSDFPHPEGLGDPVTYVKYLDSLPEEDIKRIMGGNLAEALNVAA